MLEQLERLPRGSAVGVAYVGDDEFALERLQRMTEAVEHVGLRHMRVRSLLLCDAPQAPAYEGLDALLVRPDNIATVRSTIPEGPLDPSTCTDSSKRLRWRARTASPGRSCLSGVCQRSI